MAWIDGEEAEIHRLQGDVFIQPDGTQVNANRVQLNKQEMMGLTESGQALILLTNYMPEVIDDDHVGFRRRTNHERHVYQRQVREQTKRRIEDARSNNNAGEVPHSTGGRDSGSHPASRPEAKTPAPTASKSNKTNSRGAKG